MIKVQNGAYSMLDKTSLSPYDSETEYRRVQHVLTPSVAWAFWGAERWSCPEGLPGQASFYEAGWEVGDSLTTDEAAEHLGVTRRTVQHWIKTGELACDQSAKARARPIGSTRTMSKPS